MSGATIASAARQGGATSGNTPISGSVTVSTSGTAVQQGNIITVVVATGKTLTGQFTKTFTNGGISKTGVVFCKWQYSVKNANSWTDFSAFDSSAPNSSTDASGVTDVVGSITANRSVTPAANTYDVRMIAYRQGGTSFAAITWDSPATAYVSVT